MKGSILIQYVRCCLLAAFLISSSRAFTTPLLSRQACSSHAFTLIANQQQRLSPSSVLRSSSSPQNQHSTPQPPSTPPPRSLHPSTISAISAAILLRSQNKPDMPLRFADDGKMEPWEVTLTAGKIAQPAVERWRDSLSPQERADEEQLRQEMDVMAGRIVATVSRLEELEGELLRRCETLSSEERYLLGVPAEEYAALQSREADRVEKAMAAIDAACLFDDTLRYNRAKAVFAMFLHELEGPGLRQNKVVLPCMEVDFLDGKEWNLLFRDNGQKGANKEPLAGQIKSDNARTNTVDRPSLHPLAIEAIEESFRLRAQNSTTSPLRIIDSSTEFYEVEYAAMKFADRFLQRHSKSNSNGVSWTEEELHTVGGRIVGVIMRLDDLEWEWNHRVCTSALGKIVPENEWKRTLGLHPGNVEQGCLRTVDLALEEDAEFARRRAEIVYAMFLMNIEEPAIMASGGSIVGGSSASDFIEDAKYLELMAPTIKK